MQKITKNIILVILIFSFTNCQHAQESGISQTDAEFDVFKNEFIEELWQIDPSLASYIGRHEYDSLLTIPDEQYRHEVRLKENELKEELLDFDLSALSVANQIDFRMIKNYLDRNEWYDQTFKSYEWNPAGYNVGTGFAIILTGKYAPLETRLRSLLNRLKYVPAYYQAASSNIKKPTIQHTDLAIDQNRGVLSVFGQNMLDSLEKSSLSVSEKEQFQENLEVAKAAVNDYVAFLRALRDDLTPQTAQNFRIGEDHFHRKFELDIVSSFSAREIYEIALERKDELHGKMAKLARELWPKYLADQPVPQDSLLMIRQVIDMISLNHVSPDSFIIAIEKQIPELVDFVNEKDLLTQDPSKPLVVRETPEYMAGVAGASISAPGPYDQSANTYYNVTPPTKLTPEQAESYLREYNHYILQILNIHEAIPGHYTQLIYANQSPSIVKSVLRNGAMIEGWAVYTELMMLENGYKDTPEMWLMYNKWNLRAVVNTILDYSVHVLNIPEQEAIDMLINQAFQESAEATGKWKRATLSQVQLCSYFTGFYEIYDLREELKELMGEDFNLKAFHEEFLSYGSAPVKYIREMMLEKTNKKKGV